MAIRRNGRLKPAEVASQFGISNRTAVDWLRRFTVEGSFAAQLHRKRITTYLLRGYV